jgi:hypothetical protein
VDCVKKLKPSRQEKGEAISIVVFRTNNIGDALRMARPCNACINTINRVLKHKNYKLKKIWYTNEEGNFERY